MPCAVVEVFTPEEGEECNCHDPRFPGRRPPSTDLLSEDVIAKADCACEIVQLQGEARDKCLHDPSSNALASGFCYVDPAQEGDTSQCPLVKKCPATGRRILRYMGKQPRGKTVVMCQEQSFADNGGQAERDVCLGTDGGKP